MLPDHSDNNICNFHSLLQELKNRSIDVSTSTLGNNFTIFSFINKSGYHVKIYTRKNIDTGKEEIAYFTKNLTLSDTPSSNDEIYLCGSSFIQNCLE